MKLENPLRKKEEASVQAPAKLDYEKLKKESDSNYSEALSLLKNAMRLTVDVPGGREISNEIYSGTLNMIEMKKAQDAIQGNFLSRVSVADKILEKPSATKKEIDDMESEIDKRDAQ
jgi:hypothetical protein